MKYVLMILFPLFLVSCADDNKVGTTPQDNCILQGGPQYCNNNPFQYGHYPTNRYGYWNGYNNGGFGNFNHCGYNRMPVGHPSYGLNCVPRFNANFQYMNIQNFNLPRSCRTNSQCGANATCRTQYSNYAGVCVRNR